MKISFEFSAWEDYLFWQKTDKKIIVKINHLIKEIIREPFDGIGKPEQLRYDLTGYWSRRIDHEHRIVYRIDKEKNELVIVQCRYHY